MASLPRGRADGGDVEPVVGGGEHRPLEGKAGDVVVDVEAARAPEGACCGADSECLIGAGVGDWGLVGLGLDGCGCGEGGGCNGEGEGDGGEGALVEGGTAGGAVHRLGG